MKSHITIGRRLACLLLFTVAIMVVVLDHAANVSATRANNGFKSTKLAVGRFGEIDVFDHFLSPSQSEDKHDKHINSVWLSSQKTNGSSDLYVQSNVFQPGASTGWHTHPGHSLIIVMAGTVTAYEGDDPDCKPRVYTQGMGFVDPGGDHVHILRNEGDVVAKTIAVQLLPAAATHRIDVADPANCHF